MAEPVCRQPLADPASLARDLAAGVVLAIPTESSYGLAVDPRDAAAVAQVFRIKGRPAGEPLPVVAADVEQLALLGIDVGSPVVRAVAPLWPSALSLILDTERPWPAGGGGATLAVRIPAHGGLRRLLAGIGFPLTATSANRSGQPPILDPQDLEPLLAGHAARVVDGGVLAGGSPSTLVRWSSGRGTFEVLREGRVSFDQLRPAIRRLIDPTDREGLPEA